MAAASPGRIASMSRSGFDASAGMSRSGQGSMRQQQPLLSPANRSKSEVFNGPLVAGPRPNGRPRPGLDASQSLERSLHTTGFQPPDLRTTLHGTQTAIGACRMENVGRLLPCDDRHAPIALYRSYGEWFEAGVPAPDGRAPCQSRTSRHWPYGQDVTKLYQTDDPRHKFKLDDKTVTRAKPYVPPRAGSLPHLHTMREMSYQDSWKNARMPEGPDANYHGTFRNQFNNWQQDATIPLRTPTAVHHSHAAEPPCGYH